MASAWARLSLSPSTSKPAASTARRRCLTSRRPGAGTKDTATVREGKSTLTASTPGTARSAESTLSTQDAQCMPRTGKTTRRAGAAARALTAGSSASR